MNLKIHMNIHRIFFSQCVPQLDGRKTTLSLSGFNFGQFTCSWWGHWEHLSGWEEGQARGSCHSAVQSVLFWPQAWGHLFIRAVKLFGGLKLQGKAGLFPLREEEENTPVCTHTEAAFAAAEAAVNDSVILAGLGDVWSSDFPTAHREAVLKHSPESAMEPLPTPHTPGSLYQGNTGSLRLFYFPSLFYLFYYPSLDRCLRYCKIKKVKIHTKTGLCYWI